MQKQGSAHRLVVPRVIAFLERDGRWLFLRGGPSKWFAGRLNGLGGGVLEGEDVLCAARREVREECGLEPVELRLAGTVNVTADPPVMLFVMSGRLPEGAVRDSAEGTLVWVDAADVGADHLSFLPDVAGLFAAVGQGTMFHRAASP